MPHMVENSPFYIGTTSSNGSISIAMLGYRSVIDPFDWISLPMMKNMENMEKQYRYPKQKQN